MLKTRKFAGITFATCWKERGYILSGGTPWEAIKKPDKLGTLSQQGGGLSDSVPN